MALIFGRGLLPSTDWQDSGGAWSERRGGSGLCPPFLLGGPSAQGCGSCRRPSVWGILKKRVLWSKAGFQGPGPGQWLQEDPSAHLLLLPAPCLSPTERAWLDDVHRAADSVGAMAPVHTSCALTGTFSPIHLPSALYLLFPVLQENQVPRSSRVWGQ